MATPPLRLLRGPQPSIVRRLPRLLPRAAPTPTAAAPLTETERNSDLLSRATFGITEVELARLNDMGRPAWLREQLAPTADDNLVARRTLAQLGTLRKTIKKIYDEYRTQQNTSVREMQQSALVRATYSNWQLRERMVDFWHDHFSVDIQTATETKLGHHAYDREVIRPHAFGRFEDMLIASARSVSMLEYLNGAENVAGSPNENYAREVMELHTLGVSGPYTEDDVLELARCLTGWSFHPINDDTLAGDFYFREDRHDDEAKVVLGVQIPAGGGVSDGETILSFLAQHPSTIDFVSRKLVRRFVSESAPEAAVDIIKEAWIRTDGDLQAITAVLFSDAVTDIAQPWNHRKTKRPFQFAASLFRALDVRTDDAFRKAVQAVGNVGQDLFSWPAPNGFPDSSAAWSGDLYGRWDLACDIVRDRLTGVTFPQSQLDAMQGDVPLSELAQRIDVVLTAGRAEPANVVILQDWIDGISNFQPRDFRDALSVAACSPDFFLA